MAIRASSPLPLILSAPKYFRWVFQLSASFYQYPNIPDTFLGDEMLSFPFELSRKRVELNVCESFKYFTKELWRNYLEKIFAISKVRFHHEGGLSQSRYFELFSQLDMFPSTQKSAMTEPPLMLFQMFGLISSNFVFLIFPAIFLVKNPGHYLGKTT